jgi:hypothetical protein
MKLAKLLGLLAAVALGGLAGVAAVEAHNWQRHHLLHLGVSAANPDEASCKWYRSPSGWAKRC